MRKRRFGLSVPALVVVSSLALSGCRSHHIDSTIDNRTGGVIHQVEVDYPSASFGIDSLAPGQIYAYTFKVRGEGRIKIQYVDANGKLIQDAGTWMAEGDSGQYLIILLPDGQAHWVPSLDSMH